MIAGHQSEDYEPIGWMGRVPLYATTILVITYIAAFVTGAILITTGQGELFAGLQYTYWGVTQDFWLWQLFTYPLVNPPATGIWFAIQMYLLYSFGREVERYLGRRAFLLLYGALLIAPSMLLTAVSFFMKNPPPDALTLAGGGPLNFAVFIAFAVLYPDAQVFLSLKVKWIALILFGVFSIQRIAYHEWILLGVLWLECACAILFLHARGVANASLERWLPERQLRRERPVAKRRLPARKKAIPRDEDVHGSIDPLLEKISRHGIGSLTRAERSRLEKARNALIEQDKQSH